MQGAIQTVKSIGGPVIKTDIFHIYGFFQHFGYCVLQQWKDAQQPKVDLEVQVELDAREQEIAELVESQKESWCDDTPCCLNNSTSRTET